MVITFPHMGNIYLAVKAFFDALGIPCVVPARNSKRTLKTGASVSPEEICLPFKIMMGNYIECIGRGADTILITGSCGPCRFGEYCELQMKILKSQGLVADMIVIDAPSEIGAAEFWRRIARITGESGAGALRKLNCLRGALRVLELADRADALAHARAGYEADKGACKRLLAEAKARAFASRGPAAMRRVLAQYCDRLRRVRIDAARAPLRIALVGEIYTMIEPFSNLHIEERLMDMGVCTRRPMTPSWWVRDLAAKPLKLNSPDIKAASKKYLAVGVGGHARETLAHVVQAQRAGMDGAIQIFPLGCMPEIVARAVLPAIRREKDFPVMTLVVDEITGEAGYCTRIEAFLDMLEARRKR